MKIFAVQGWMCQTRFDFELGQASGGTTIYSSEEDLRKNSRCTGSCGIQDVITLSVDDFVELAKAAGKTDEDFVYSSIGPPIYTKKQPRHGRKDSI